MFEKLKEGLEEAIEFHKGKVKLRVKEVYIPDAPKKYSAKDIKKLRNKLRFTQQEFALWLNVSLNTVQAWEQGVRVPSHSSLRLIEMFDKNFSFVKDVLVNKKPRKQHSDKKTSSSYSYSGASIVAKSK